MVLDVVESHLYRRHPEVVRTEIEHWQTQLLHKIPSNQAPVVACVVKHQDGVTPPVEILRVKVLTKLHQEEPKGMPIGLAAVHSVQELTSAGQSSYDIHTLDALSRGHLVLLTLLLPTPLPMVSVADAALIYVHDADSSMEGFDEPRSCKLPLKLGRRVVLKRLDRLHLTI